MAHGIIDPSGAKERYKRYDRKAMDSLIDCYQSVFADLPWNEWKKCQVCGKYWGNKDLKMLERWYFRHHNVPLVPFWTYGKVQHDLIHEIGPDASCWLTYREQEIIGFCWGYQIRVPSLEMKLGIHFAQALSDLGLTTATVAYQDELGVRSLYRGQKIAKTLFTKRHEDFIKQGLTVGIVRTREGPEPSVTYEWFTKKFGYEVVARYPNGDGRVVLAQRLSVVTQILGA